MESLYIFGSVVLVSMISFIGVFSLAMSRVVIERIVIYLVSFSAGALFGDAFIHLLPAAYDEAGADVHIAIYVLMGIVFLFIVEKFIHWRHCHIHGSKDHVHPFAWVNLVGDGVHNFIDGLTIAASYIASVPVGIATTLAVILHEIPQEIGDFGVLIKGGFSKRKALTYNFLSALSAVLGAAVAIVLSSYVEDLLLFLLPFAAGHFIYIAGADLIPELHKEVGTKKSMLQLLFFIGGICIMLLLLLIE